MVAKVPSELPNVTRLKREERIGSGLTSDVFSWGEGRVLKLFFPWVMEETIRREYTITQAIQKAGVRIPQTFEVVRIEQRSGIVFERVRGRSLLKKVEARPWTLFRGARQLAELHARVHACLAPEVLPTQQQQIARWIDGAVDFSDAEKAVAREHAARQPAGRSLCHGDFHPGNILLTEEGPVIIDWAWATRGHPLADVARTSVLFESANLPPKTPLHIVLLMKVARRLLHVTYLNRYFELCQGTTQELETGRVPQRMAGSAWRAARKAAMAKTASQV